MASFGKSSMARLNTCHALLQKLFLEVVKHQDCSVLEGHRSDARQDELFHLGMSKLRGGESTHNALPSNGIDVVPWPVDWDDKSRFLLFVGRVRGIADTMGIPLRCGADWDGDGLTSDQSFHDLPHFELIIEQLGDNNV